MKQTDETTGSNLHISHLKLIFVTFFKQSGVTSTLKEGVGPTHKNLRYHVIFQLIYTCALNANVTCAKLNEIAQMCHSAYGDKKITGLSLCKNGSVLHILEGDRTTVEALYENILKDNRTINKLVLLRREIPDREFKTWSMGLKNTENTKATFILNTTNFSKALPDNSSSELNTIIKTFERVNGLFA